MIKNHTCGLKVILLVFFLIIVCTSCSSSRETLNKTQTQQEIDYSVILENIKKSGVLRVGTTGDFRPFSYIDDSAVDSYSGVDIEMAKNLAKSLGVELKLIKTSWPRLMTDLKDEKFDIAMSGITITPERKKQANFSNATFSSGKAAITRDENVFRYGAIKSINSKGVRVIVNPGGTNESFALANFPNATIIQNDDNISIFQKIIDGEADVMVTDAIETLVQERVHPELEAVNPDTPFNAFHFGYLFKKDTLFKEYIDQWLGNTQKEFLHQKLLTKELEKIE